MRNLGRLTANGTLLTGGEAVQLVVHRLADSDALRHARLHPIQVLSAPVTYASGTGVRGGLRWDPFAELVNALDAAFYATFGNVTPAGKRTLLALDVSGSMTLGTVAGVRGLTPRVASAAMAAVTLGTEPIVETVAFTSSGRDTWAPKGATRPGRVTSTRRRRCVSTASGRASRPI